jgi:antitoxin ParD1/3/4
MAMNPNAGRIGNGMHNSYLSRKGGLIMPNLEKISIALTPELAAAVRAAVASGEYVSSNEVVRAALRDWQLRRALHQKDLEELRRLWKEGTDSGPGPARYARSHPWRHAPGQSVRLPRWLDVPQASSGARTS